MAVAAIDLQGFHLINNEFSLKEISILIEQQYGDILFKPAENNRLLNHCGKLDNMLRTYLNVEYIYLRGIWKYWFVQQKITALNLNGNLIDLGVFDA